MRGAERPAELRRRYSFRMVLSKSVSGGRPPFKFFVESRQTATAETAEFLESDDRTAIIPQTPGELRPIRESGA